MLYNNNIDVTAINTNAITNIVTNVIYIVIINVANNDFKR